MAAGGGAGRHRRSATTDRRSRLPRRFVIVLGLYFAFSVSAVAWAYWGSTVAAGGHGAATLANVNQGATPAASMTSAQTVTVTWGASTLTDGQAVDGYLVKRYDANTLALQTILTNCTGTVAATSCVESSVPYGQWKYSVTPVIAANWQGAESARSGTVVVGASTLTLAKTLYGGSLPQTTTGTLSGFVPNEGITYRLDAGTALTGAPSTANASGNATITALTIPSGTADGSHTVYAIGANSSQASAGITVDLTAPTVSAALNPAANGAGWGNSSPVQVTLTANDGTGSGVSQLKYTTDGTDPKTSGTVQVYSAPISVGSTGTVKYYATDVAGNASAVATQAVNIDAAAPVNSLALSNVTGNAVRLGGTVYYRGVNSGSFTLTNTVTDSGGSGAASSGTAALTGVATGWTHTSSSVTSPAGGPYVSNAFSWTAGTTSSPSETVTGADAAGNTTSTTLTYLNDSSGPSGGSVDVSGLVGTGGRYSVSTSLSVVFGAGTDPAGLASSGAQLLRASASLSNGSCGTYGSYAQVGSNDPVSPKADVVADQACYRYEYVVADALGNPTTYASGDVKVDTTGPAAPSLGFSALTNAYGSGSTVYYRSNAAAGGFTVTASGTDAASGIASYTFPSLGTNWTGTPGSLGVDAYSWSGAPAAPGTVSVTATNNAGTTSTGASLTFTSDTTAPSGGSITYTNGYTTGGTVSVTLATGTDGGSGINTGSVVLQRAVAPLTSGTCGSYGPFVTIATNPAASYTDVTVANGNCYQYQYVVPDNVGNQTTYTSASVAKTDYTTAVSATTGLVSQWRLGESTVSSDTFTDTSGATLSGGHTGEIGATWTHLGGSGNEVVTDANRIRHGSNTYSIDYTSATPSSADYSVEADVYVKSNVANDDVGIFGRANTGTKTFYMARYEQSDGSWNIVKYTNGTKSYLNYVTGNTLTVGQTYRLRLSMVGTALKLYVNGALITSTTDSSLSTAGRVGIMDGDDTNLVTKTNTTGYHLDNFAVQLRAADSKGSNTGDYFYGPTLGATGAIYGDANTAMTTGGVNQYVQAISPTGLPVGASARSVELWFKTSSTARQALYSYGSLTNAGMFGLILEGSTSMTGWSYGSGNDKTFTLSSSVTDGAWHHVVETYNGTAITVYVDGTALPAQNVALNTVLGSTGFGIGANLPTGDVNSGLYFNGSLDEVAVYNTALSTGTVGDHYNLGHGGDTIGPSGGSVDVSGLVGTGGRYSASMSLSVVFGAGTDPAGLASSGAQLLRASASLSNGTCGSYGSYAQVGSNDPVSPKADVVADQACYRYEYIVADALGNPTTYTSGDVKVDTTGPAAPSLGFSALSNAYGSGSTVYYRSNAATGGFTVTASGTDAASGIASYTFPSLGTNWTATPGSLGVDAYSWSGAPAAPGTVSVTATNNAGTTSTGAALTFTSDTTAPSGGSITYTNGYTTSPSISVSFTTGTDGGSGISTSLGQLQRAVAPFFSGACGTYGVFTTITTGPSTPYTDTTGGGCVKYQYVASDNVGNQATYTSASVIKPDYYNAVSTTAGLVSYWRMGVDSTASDTFSDIAATALQSHTGDTNDTWTKFGAGNDAVVTDVARLRKTGTGFAHYYSSATPSSANYAVAADITVKSVLDYTGVIGRQDTSNANGTYYLFRYEDAGATWDLLKVVNGTATSLGTSAQTLTVGQTYRARLEMNGTTISGWVNGTKVITVTDSAIVAAGKGGVRMGYSTSTNSVTDTTGLHLDNFAIVPDNTGSSVTDTKGSNTGTLANSPLLNVYGAAFNDINTGVTMNGTSNYMQVATPTGLPVGGTARSVEMWFKTATTAKQSLFSYGTLTTAGQFGLWMENGTGMTTWGYGNGNDKQFTAASSLADNAWHHLVVTYASSAIYVYVDGVSLTPGNDHVVTLNTTLNPTYGLGVGANLPTGDQNSGLYFSGSIDEVAIYNQALGSSTISDHYHLGHGS